VLREYGSLCEFFGIDASSSGPVLESASLAELLLFSQALSQLRKHLAKLQWHSRVNEHAISKIYSKIANAGGEQNENVHKSRWMEPQLARDAQYLRISQRMVSLDAAVTMACSAASTNVKSEFLHLKTIFQKVKLDTTFYGEILLLIANDEHARLVSFCQQHITSGTLSRLQAQELFGGLLYTAFVYHSRQCVLSLVSLANEYKEAIIEAACIVDLVKASCRSPSSPRSAIAQKIIDSESRDTGQDLLLELFQRLDPVHEIGLHIQDKSGRLLLHCVAEYGLTSVCVLLLEVLKEDSRILVSAERSVLSPDFQNETPLHCAVINNHLAVTRLFLSYLKPDESDFCEEQLSVVFTEVMIIAIVLGYDEMVEFFISAQIGTCRQNGRGETALYVAAKLGRDDYVKLLLQATLNMQVIDSAEYAYGWTPLFVACVEGHLAIAELLLHAGASCTRVDTRGWSIKEHAAFRGHLELATLVQAWTDRSSTSNLRGICCRPGAVAGDAISTEYSYVIVNLGSVQKTRLFDPVKLTCLAEDYDSTPVPVTSFLLEMSIRGGDIRRRVRLPLMDDLVNDPFVFPCDLSKNSQLVLKLYRATATHPLDEVLVGGGVVLIDYVDHLDHKRESLVREYTASIMARDTLDCIGFVTFTLVISKPYTKLQDPLEGGYWFGEDTVQIIGHRGSASFDCCLASDFTDLLQGLARTCRRAIFSLERTRFR
jgi:glycerophosphodiester phosphodiesterase